MLKTNEVVMRRSQFMQQGRWTIHANGKECFRICSWLETAAHAKKNWSPYSTNLTPIYSHITVQLSGIIHQIRAGTLADFYLVI